MALFASLPPSGLNSLKLFDKIVRFWEGLRQSVWSIRKIRKVPRSGCLTSASIPFATQWVRFRRSFSLQFQTLKLWEEEQSLLSRRINAKAFRNHSRCSIRAVWFGLKHSTANDHKADDSRTVSSRTTGALVVRAELPATSPTILHATLISTWTSKATEQRIWQQPNVPANEESS